MRYFLCLIPPLAILVSGFRPVTLVLNIALTLAFYVPGVIHAVLVVNSHKADKRAQKITDAIDKQTKAIKTDKG